MMKRTMTKRITCLAMACVAFLAAASTGCTPTTRSASYALRNASSDLYWTARNIANIVSVLD